MSAGAGRTQALAVAALVGMTTLYLWCKVEMGTAAESMARARVQLESLDEERAKLLAQVARQTRPTRLQRLAQEELGMVFPASVGQLERRLAKARD